jgi:hypothetical protein
MFRTPILAAFGVALMSSAALAQPDNRAPTAPPAQLNGPGDSRSYDDRDAPRGDDDRVAQDDQRSRDLFCRRDAAARTGYVSPGQAANRAQTGSSVGGALLGAAAGAAIGSASGNAAGGALIGGGVGLLAGTAAGQDNARRAAADVERAYGDAYYACMGEADAYPDDRAGPRYAYDYPPPRYAYDYYGPPPVYRPYYAYPYFGPSITFGFGFGGGYHRGFGGFHGGFRGHR